MPSGIWSLTMLLPDIAQISFTPLRITFCFRTIERYDIFTRYTSLPSIIFCPFDFFLKDFNLWLPLLMITLYYQTKTSIDFWCKQELNSDSLDCFSYFFSVCWIINIYYSTQTKKKKKKAKEGLLRESLGPCPSLTRAWETRAGGLEMETAQSYYKKLPKGQGDGPRNSLLF